MILSELNPLFHAPIPGKEGRIKYGSRGAEEGCEASGPDGPLSSEGSPRANEGIEAQESASAHSLVLSN
jgi:hypothetical protein